MSGASPSNALTPPQAVESLIQVAEGLYKGGWASHWMKSLYGGFFLSFGGLAALIAAGGSVTLRNENPGLAKVISAVVFPPGLIFVVLTGGVLCTASMMTVTMAGLKRRVPLWFLPASWMFQFFGNLVGALLFDVFLVHLSGLVSADPYATYVQTFATQKIAPSWGAILCRGIGCNVMVCVAIWFNASSREMISKYVGIYIPIFIFILAGWDHVVANMMYFPTALMERPSAPLTTGYYIWKSMIPSFIGNLIGGWILALPLTFMSASKYGGMPAAPPAQPPRSDIESGAPSSSDAGTPSSSSSSAVRVPVQANVAEKHNGAAPK